MSEYTLEGKKMGKDRLKCYCGKWAKPAKLKIEGLEVRGWRCGCGEEYLHPEDSLRVSALKKLQTEALKATVTMTGNSFALRIPKEAADVLALKVGEKLSVFFERPRKLVFCPA